ncbi:hypothetical protein L2D08_19490 [Domibacillus sp. PGB-M46]|uniref:hypothetical protein n=1 Tax=Domibacillus sp. PGB-M46 TaxID=2910255 RepID=UPI001F572EB0|nr:hypothetical protein [Domibacillus sp. PGB-M46]MCI2256526.1 hypothetical protein [Domibacillus sp. PGB-M46]
MKQVCFCCHEKIIYLEADNVGTGIAYYGTCECGAVVNYRKDKNGRKVDDYSRCPDKSKD